ncbi:MAG: threonine synthase [Alphaproteobacteria bacterium]|jgi:threonine synthase|nr:threonine synthase [Rhodospirillaceae bacterium]MBT7615150.1 threonine synthase [Rhodospirillaceae bacterium]MBT7648869.1 threonine synthase [Rhodospirillaceae bacterium]MDG2482189.1 threonine synthase [Alphaproteobacteria bacterium]
MQYLSTRGQAPVLDFEDVLLAGLASDGGLYLPETWPRFSAAQFRAMQGLPYSEIAARVFEPFVEGWIEPDELAAMTAQTYAVFDHPAVVPMVQTGDNDWLLELFHGPTFAFKDVALQLLGRLFDRALERRGARITIVGATSGDTGSAAIAGCAGRSNMDVYILYPQGRVSEVQRRQMTTVDAANVHCIAVEGTFDDCQAMVKAMFNDAPFRRRINLAAVNSINWARVMAQTAYYVASAVRLGAPDREIAYCVPSANFGACFAGYVAKAMGLPISRFVVATNTNDILHRFLESGSYRPTGVVPTLSPSMDIQISSNFERLLFEVHGRDGDKTGRLMARLAQSGGFEAEPEAHQRAKTMMASHRLDDDGIRAEIARMHGQCGITVDPHTACGTAAARAVGLDPAIPVITHAQADPAKFPDAVAGAIGQRPAMPKALQRIMEMPEHATVLPNELAAVQAFITGESG